MGWIHCTKPAGISAVDFLRGEIFRPTTGYDLVAAAQTPRACYFAYRIPAPMIRGHAIYTELKNGMPIDDLDLAALRPIFEPAADRSIVTALVVLYDDPAGGAFNYKPMDETTGPFDDGDCPKEILDLLSPLRADAPGYAARWRGRQKAASASAAPPPA
jgi:hypothetical protein